MKYHVDVFAVNKLLQSNSKQLKDIGNILFRCEGVLEKDDIEKIAKLLAEVDEEIEQQLAQIEEYEESL